MERITDLAGGGRAILIAGPTASGKSALALALADATGGAVVNADSMQVYRELRVLSARPGPDETARAPHLLYGHVPMAEPYSVARWLAEVSEVLGELGRAGQTPIVVGGTGLYFTALTEGLSEVPEIPDQIREHWRARGRKEDAGALHAVLGERDPAMAARLRPSDAQRIVRALEVIDATGRSLADWQADTPPPLLPGANCRRIVLAPERGRLRERIARRFDMMLEAGAREEAERIAALRLDPVLPAMRAIGLAPLIAHGLGLVSLEDARARAVADSARYAKRQETWFRNRFPDWERMDPDDTFAKPASL